MDFSIKNGGSFHSYVNVYQAGYTITFTMENHHVYPFLIDKPSINGPFPMAKLNSQRVYTVTSHSLAVITRSVGSFWLHNSLAPLPLPRVARVRIGIDNRSHGFPVIGEFPLKRAYCNLLYVPAIKNGHEKSAFETDGLVNGTYHI